MRTEITDIKYENRIVAFVDILGFKEIIKKSERNLTKLHLLYQTLEFLKKESIPTSGICSLSKLKRMYKKGG